MNIGPLTVEIISMFCLAVFLLHKYGNVTKQHVIVTLSVLIAWYFSFIIIFILPLDVSSTAYRQCLSKNPPPLTTTDLLPSDITITTSPGTNITDVNSTQTSISYSNVTDSSRDEFTDVCQVPWSVVSDPVMRDLWRVVYWTSQCLTWIILPLMQSYSQAGDFTVAGKLKSALIDNAIYYGSYLLIFGVLLIYIAARPDIDLDAAKLKVICITASNTWGLFLLVLLLGYGLVEVPRSCWFSAKRGYMLNYTYFKAAKLSTEKSEAEETLDDILEDIQRVAESIRSSHPLRKNVETILQKCPDSFKALLTNPNRRRPSDDGNIPTQTPTEKSLVRLHRQLIKALKTQRRTQTQWNNLVERALQLEDVARNEGSNERYFKTAFQVPRPQWIRAIYTPTIEWYWKCLVRGWVYRVLAVTMAIISAIVVWSEVTFFNQSPVLSLFAVFVDLAKKNYNYFQIELVSILTLAYLCVCTYYTVFKIRILNYYYIAPYHQTDEYSLIFSGMLLCRLTPPMCLNFLGLIHLDSHVTKNHNTEETSYTKIMGHMDVISFISDGFNIYLPILILLLCLATYFNLGSRCLHILGFQQFIGDDDMTSDLLEEGKELIKREKRKRQRVEEGENRRKQFNEKFNGNALYRNARTRDRPMDSRGDRILQRDNSTESTRAELLRDVELIDYTTEQPDVYDAYSTFTTQGSSDQPLYQGQSDPNRWSYSSRSWTNQPPRGIFDDV